MSAQHGQCHDQLIISIIEAGAFTLLLQPLARIDEKCIESFEALVRFGVDFENETGLSVEKTVARIEQINRHEQFDLCVIKKCCEIIIQARCAGFDSFKVAINLCSATLGCKHFPDKLNEILKQHHVSPSDIVLEVTERSYVSPSVNQHIIPRLMAYGYQFAIDDFVSGYSNFGALASNSANIVKIDNSVASALSHSPIARQFSRGILQLIEALGKRAVFEGVETIEQYLFLQSIGCTCIQGYFVSKPLPTDEALVFLSNMHQMVFPTVFDLSNMLIDVDMSQIGYELTVLQFSK